MVTIYKFKKLKVGLIFLISSEKLSYMYVINVLDITYIMRQSACLKYTYSILPLSNCQLSPENGQLSKLHVKITHFYLRVQRENAQCLSKYFIFWLRCILSRTKSSYLSSIIFQEWTDTRTYSYT